MRFIGGEGERGENVRWCEEMGKFEGVFIGGNGNKGYTYNKYSKKTCKTCKKNVQNQLTKVQKTCSWAQTTGHNSVS